MGFLRKLFGSAPRSAEGPASRADKGKPREGVRPDESLDALYAEFCRTFCIRPGVNLMDYLKEKGVFHLIAWLHPSTPCALPKGFIRLGVDATRKGYKIWEQPGLTMRYEGNWDKNGGLPDQESLDALSVLCQVLSKPITLYYTETEDGEVMVMKFEP